MQINFLPKQLLLKQLIEDSSFSWIGYGGSRGGAKSHAIRDIAIYLGYKYNAKSLIFRRYSQELRDTHMYPIFKLYPELRDYFNKTEMVLYNQQGNPIVKLGYADRPDDIYTFQGAEYDFIFIDEATQCTQEMIEFLRTSNRTTNPLIKKAKMILTMNPGGVGHAYIKRLFVDNIHTDNENPDDYAFIQSHVWDNVFWVLPYLREQKISVEHYYNKLTEDEKINMCLKHSDYAKNLSNLPEDMKKAYLYGDWDVFGGLFFKYFSKKQIVEPFVIPRDWKLIASLDPGTASPCSFGLMARSPDNRYYRIGTYYEPERNMIEHAEGIHNYHLSGDSVMSKWTGGRKPSLYVAGHDAWAKQHRYSPIASDITWADVFREKGMFLQKAVTDRIPGWQAVKSLMPTSQNDGNLYIFDHFNKPLIEQLTSVESDKKNPEDIYGRGNDPNVEDHALDEFRYGIMSLYKPFNRLPAPETKERLINMSKKWSPSKF